MGYSTTMVDMHKKILFYPRSGENQYTQNVFDVVKGFADEVEQIEPVSFKLLKNGFNAYDIAIVHWLDNTLVNKQKKMTVLSIAKYLVKILILKYLAKKIVYVRHNVYPHALKGNSARIAEKVIDTVAHICSASVVHSGHLAHDNTVYLPHPLYKIDSRQPLVKSETFAAGNKFVIFGRIVEYKAIHRLLKFWGNDTLVVAGKCDSVPYLESLNAIVAERKLDQVSIQASFLSDTAAANLVSSSDGLVITHNDQDMIVSGSFFFAASLGVPVHAVRSPFFEWLIKEYQYPGLFLYDSLELLAIQAAQQPLVSRQKILNAAESLFGDKAVIRAWENFLIQLG